MPLCLVLTTFALVANLATPSLAALQPAAPSTPDAEQASHGELNKQLNNPVSTVWSLNFQPP